MAGLPAFGRVVMLEVGERSADAYGALFPELETLDKPVRTWRDLQVAVDAAVVDTEFNSGNQDRPNVLIIDSMSEAWAELRSTADREAISRFTRRNKGADIPVMDASGQPTRDKTFKTEGNRKLEFAATAILRCESPGVVTLRGMTSPGAEPIGVNGVECPTETNPIEWALSRLPGRGSFEVVELPAGLISVAQAKAVWAGNPLLADLGKDDSVDESFITDVVAGIPALLERLAVEVDGE